jgi:hypothetical protein
MRLRGYCCLIVAVGLLLCSPALAAVGEESKEVKQQEPVAASPTASTPDMESSSETDPARSAIAGTSLERRLKRDASVYTLRRGPGGIVRLNLGEGFRHAIVMYTGPDGKSVVGCISSEKEAEAIFGPKQQETSAPSKEQ